MSIFVAVYLYISNVVNRFVFEVCSEGLKANKNRKQEGGNSVK